MDTERTQEDILKRIAHDTTPTHFAVVHAMATYGGSFASALAAAFSAADAANTARLKAAFPELLEEYAEMARILRAQGRGPR